VELEVEEGEHVRAGESVMGWLPPADDSDVAADTAEMAASDTPPAP
jgi:hypothetical protein